MRRKVGASILALVLCALMVPPQVGLTVRGAATGQEAVGELPVEDSSQEAWAQESDVDQEVAGEGMADAPIQPTESMVPNDTTVPEETPVVAAAPEADTAAGGETGEIAEQTETDVPASEQGEPSGDPASQETEQSETDAPEEAPTDGQVTDGSVTDDAPEPEEGPVMEQEPVAEETPEDGEQPTAEDGAGVYTPAEVDSIIGNGISLARLQELMQVSMDSGKAVPEKYFKFALAGLTGYETKAYHEYSALQGNPDGYKVGPWPDKASGDVTAGKFPEVERLTFDSLVLNGTVIASIGVVTVTVQGEEGSPTAKDYVSHRFGDQRGRDGAPGRRRGHAFV